METWRWPKASYRVSSMSWAVRPSREAVSRSMTKEACRPLVLLIAVHIRQLGQGAQFLQDPRAPGIQLLEVLTPEGELIKGGAGEPADPQILNRLQVGGRPRNLGELGAQPGNHLAGGGPPFLKGLQGNKHAPRIGGGSAATGAAGETQWHRPRPGRS